VKFYSESKFQDVKDEKIPADWKFVEIKDVASVKEGIYGKRSDDGDIIQLKADSIRDNGRINNQAFAKITIDRAANDYFLNVDDVLLNNRNSAALVGKSALFRGELSECVFGNLLTRIRIHSEGMLPGWLLYRLMQLQGQGFLKAISTRAVNQALLKKGTVEKLMVPMPPISEQRSVIQVLDDIDSAIELTDRVVVKTERLKKGLMQRLLTKGIEHKEFRDTEIGKIPQEWQVTKIGKHVELLTGFPFKSSLFSKDKSAIKLVRGINVTTGRLRWDRTQYWNKSIEGLEKYLLAEKDVLIGMDGALVGHNYAIVKKEELPLLLVQRVARLRVREGMHPEFLYHLIGSHPFLRYVESVNTSSGIAHISEKQIENFKIPLPSFGEQLRIVDVLSTIGSKLQLEIEEESKLKRIKLGLMDLLLTGKVRIKAD
jgi:type I restriction enzyme S subunit